MPKVAIVFPYFRTHAQTEMLFPPLGAASLAAQLRRLKIETKIFDCTFATHTSFQEAIRAYQPDIVGIYSMVTLSRNTFQIAEMIKENMSDSLLVAGGPLPTLYPNQYNQRFDAIFRGEADLSFPRFCQDYFTRNISLGTLAELPLESYEGLTIQKQDLQIDNPEIHYSEKVIETFPVPDRSDFNHTIYQKEWLNKNGSKTTSIITTFGCPFDCDFCSRPVFGNHFRKRDLDAIFEEIEQIQNLGYDSLWIADDNFTLNLHFLEEFCSRLSGREIAWSCLSRVTGINQEIAKTMKEAGCRRVYLGLESGSPSTLQLMNKRATLDEGTYAVHQFQKAGIQVAAFFIVGYPGETSASIEATFKLALTLPLDEISFNVPYPLPGSRLFERVSGIDETKDWNVENDVAFLYQSEFDSDWLRMRIEQTLQAFSEKQLRPLT
jgi:radical SAM superfamily enzyme YgiQ (UPF0313 family)